MEEKKDTIFDEKFLALAILAVVAGGLMLFNSGAQPTATAEDYLDQARQAVTQDYNIQNAQGAFENVLTADPGNEVALYNLARIYYIVNDYDKALDTIAAYKELYPENKRIHYVAGLANAYAGDLEQSEQEFTEFVNSGLASWPGYLDLAWAHFQQGEIENAHAVLSAAVEQFGDDNAWLNASLGGVYVALGESEAAVEVLERARTAAEGITREEWHANFSFNDPRQIEGEMAQMLEVIDFNLALANGEEVDEAQVLGVPFADPSPAGALGGLAVSACGDACPHTTCTRTNACGNSNTGEYITCLDSCSVSAPADPSGTCQVTTPCGNASGYIGCNGTCNVTSMSSCNSNGVTIVTQNNNNFNAADIDANIVVTPQLVKPGETTNVQWISTETSSCTVTAANGDSWTGLFGEQTSGAITGETTYVLTCTAFDDSTVTDSATVRIVPAWQEF